jgi:serine/threonine protein kinase
VHRDVKGDNVLVRHSDGRAFLIDFGSCHFQGAPRLTWESLAPHTPAYLSAQAGLFDIRLVRNRDSYYSPSAEDDLFALGVTAYRLVMGHYPPPMDAQQDEEGSWHVTSPDPRPLLENNPRVSPLLRELILRLLSDSPEARGTATQVAETLEAAANQRVPEPLPEPQPASEASPPKLPAPIRGGALPERGSSLAHPKAWKPWLAALAAVGVCVVLLWNVQPVPLPPGHMSASTPEAENAQAADAGTAAVGDSSPTLPQASAPPPREQKPIVQESPPKPRPGQTRPDGKGQCPGRKQVPLNGGCWLVWLQLSAEECAENGYVPFKGKCYAPALAPPQKPPPTSSPAEAR